MKNKKAVLLVLCLLVALCCVVALTACDKNDHKTSYEEGDVILDIKEMDFFHFDMDSGYGYSYSGTKIQVKYLVQDGSKSYVTLEGEDNDSLVVTGHKGAIKKLSLKEIEDAVKINKAGIAIIGIGEGAFAGNTSLQEADLTKSCKSLEFTVEDSAFMGCSALTTVTLPEQVYTSIGNKIGNSAFASCPVLSSVSFTSSFNDIGKYAFAGCQSLTSISLPDTVNVIREGTFSMCDALESFSGAQGIRSIQNEAFRGTALTGFDFGKFASLKYVGRDSFNGSKLGTVEIPNTVTYIGEGAFINIAELQEIKIPFLGYSVAENSDWTFEGVYGMANMDEDNLRSLSLTVAATPSIPNGGFRGSAELTSITVSSILDDGNYNVYDETGTSYTKMSVLSSHDIPNYAFYGCERLTSVSMPAGVINIGESAFENCRSLASYTFPETVEMLGGSAFKNCSALTELSLPSSLKAIAPRAFYGCANLSSPTLPTKLLLIGEKAFYGCSSITEMTLPASLESIGTEMLGDCTSLTKLTIERYNWITDAELVGSEIYMVSPTTNLFSSRSEVMQELGYQENGPMYYVPQDHLGVYLPTSLKEVSLGGVNYLLQDAFRGWTSLKKVSLGFRATALQNNGEDVSYEIGWNAFNGCTNLETLTVTGGDKVTAINNGAFRNCRSLTESPVFSKVESIGDQAFYGCYALQSVVFPASVKSYGTAILGDCINLRSVEIKNYNWVEGEEDGDQHLVTAPTSGLFTDGSTYMTEIDIAISESKLYTANTSFGDGVYLPKSLTTFIVRGANVLQNSAFNGFSRLENVTLEMRSEALRVNGDDVSFSIGPNAFQNCENLATFTATNFDKVETIDSQAFCNCRSLTAVPEMSGVKTLGNSVFYGCRNITEFTLPASVTSIGTAILGDCISLESLTIENYNYTVNTYSRAIETSYLFANHSDYYNEATEGLYNPSELKVYVAYGWYVPASLENITCNNVVWIAENMFRSFTSLKNIAVNFVDEENVECTINAYAFYDCNQANITFTNLDNVTAIGQYAFAKTPIEEFEINSGITQIAQGVFMNCEDLTKVTIWANLAVIRPYAFQGCTSLETLVINSLDRVENDAFADCNKLETVYYGQSAWNTTVYSGNSALTAAKKLCQNSTKCVHDEDHWRLLEDGTVSTDLTIGEAEVITEPTCTDAGQSKSTCTICNEEFTYTVEALGHALGDGATVTKEPECGVPGMKHGTCTRCGGEVDLEIPALEHEAADWVVVTEPSCGTGLKTISCIHCNTVMESEVISATTPFTIDNSGYCSECGSHLVHMSLNNTTCGVCHQEMPFTMTNEGSPYTFVLDGNSAEYVSNNKGISTSSAYLTITASEDVVVGFWFSVSSEETYDKLYIFKNGLSSSPITDDNGNTIPAQSSGVIDFQGNAYNVTLHAGETLTFQYYKDGSTNSHNDEARLRWMIITNAHNVTTPAE